MWEMQRCLPLPSDGLRLVLYEQFVNARIAGTSGAGGSYQYDLNTGKFNISGDGGNGTTTSVAISVETNKWTHLCGVDDDSAQAIYTYKNGALDKRPGRSHLWYFRNRRAVPLP